MRGISIAGQTAPIDKMFELASSSSILTIGIGDGGIGHITQQLYDVLTGIQFGKTEDPMGWVVHLK